MLNYIKARTESSRNATVSLKSYLCLRYFTTKVEHEKHTLQTDSKTDRQSYKRHA